MPRDEFVVEKLDPSGNVWVQLEGRFQDLNPAIDRAHVQTIQFAARTRVVRRTIEGEFTLGAVEVPR